MANTFGRPFARQTGTDRWLRWSLSLSDKVASVFSFSAIVGYTLDFHGYFFRDEKLVIGVEALKAFVSAKAWPLALAAVTLIWFMRYKSAVRNEMEIIFSCFSKLNPLPDWGALLGSRYVPLMAILLTLTFLLLGALVERISLYALVVLVINIMDVRGNSVIRRNLTRFFLDNRYVPLPDDPSGEFVLRRRAAAEGYWIARPQIERIGLIMIVMVIAILLSTPAALAEIAPAIGALPGKEAAYILVMITILANTATMAIWRKSRDDILFAVERDEADALERRVAR